MWRHPKYYKELRKRNKPAGTGGALCVDPEAGSDQAISYEHSTESEGVRPGPGPKPRYTPTGILLGVDLGDKPQASSAKLRETQASSGKHQAPSTKAQA